MPWLDRIRSIINTSGQTRSLDSASIDDLRLEDIVAFFHQQKRTVGRGSRLQDTGELKARTPGMSLDFVQLRAFQSGDDVRHIDWRASAIHDQLVVRHFAAHQRQVTHVIIDASDSMRWPQRLFPILGPSSHWFACAIASALTYVLLLRRDCVTLLIPGETPEQNTVLGPIRTMRELPTALRRLAQISGRGRFPWRRVDALAQETGLKQVPGRWVLLSDFLTDWNQDNLAALRRMGASGTNILAVHLDTHRRELAYLATLGHSLLLTDREDAASQVTLGLDPDCGRRLDEATAALHHTVRSALTSPLATVTRLNTTEMETGRQFLLWMRDTFLRMGAL